MDGEVADRAVAIQAPAATYLQVAAAAAAAATASDHGQGDAAVAEIAVGFLVAVAAAAVAGAAAAVAAERCCSIAVAADGTPMDTGGGADVADDAAVVAAVVVTIAVCVPFVATGAEGFSAAAGAAAAAGPYGRTVPAFVAGAAPTAADAGGDASIAVACLWVASDSKVVVQQTFEWESVSAAFQPCNAVLPGVLDGVAGDPS